MKLRFLKTALALGIWCLMVFSAARTGAFSLLGPFQPWMEQTNDLRQQGDIGGPMLLGSGYRWNVPVVTYGFDPSFIQYFGTNGVAAVEGAIQIINDLPPSSQIALTNLPYDTTHFNGNAQGEYLLDLKSTTLSLLLEHLGLAQPTRYIYVLRQWNPVFAGYQSWENDWPDWVFPDYISERNFDPQTLSSNLYVNNQLYIGYIQVEGNFNAMITLPASLSVPSPTAVADQALELGSFYTGLSYDDVGGLKYLYSTNTVQYETLLSGVSGIGANSFVNGAWRPGVDKIEFIAQSIDSVTGSFLPMTNYYTDTYVSNGVSLQQPLQRVILQPDFIFSAGGVDYGSPTVVNISPGYFALFNRTGTTNWINNALQNGNLDGEGPGTIQPQVKINFNKLGNMFFNFEDQELVEDSRGAEDGPVLWGSFDATTNYPILYPAPQNGIASYDVRMLLQMGQGLRFFQKEFDWPMTNAVGSVSLFQISSNLIDWSTDFSATNDGTVWTFQEYNPVASQRFYRVVPQ